MIHYRSYTHYLTYVMNSQCDQLPDRWLDSSVGRALLRYRSQLHNCDDQSCIHIFLLSLNIWSFIYLFALRLNKCKDRNLLRAKMKKNLCSCHRAAESPAFLSYDHFQPSKLNLAPMRRPGYESRMNLEPISKGYSSTRL